MSKLNVTPCTIKQVKESMLMYYLNGIRKGVPVKSLDAIFLWSCPGVGKSQMVQQIVDELSVEIGKKVRFVEIRLSECSIFELLGLMHRDPDSNSVVYDAPPIYKVEEEEEFVVYLFDEMDKASKQLQAAALHLVLDKVYWQYELPKNSIVIAAGNPENIDGELFSKFAPELNNRFCHYLLEADFPAWEFWARANGVNHYVISFLESNQHLLYSEDAGMEHTACNTPRTWMKVSAYLNVMMEDNQIPWDVCYFAIGGYLGSELALQFKTFCLTEGLMPRPEDIVQGKSIMIPKKADLKDAVSKSLVKYLASHKEKLSQREWAFAREYMDAFPEEYAIVFYRNIAAHNLQNRMMGFMSDHERVLWKRRYAASMNIGG